MDVPLPKQSGSELNRQAYQRLIDTRKAVLTMTTGGCARYAFSTDIEYCLDRRGNPLLIYTSGNPHHHLVVTNTTMDLRLPHELDAEGNELSILILTGLLRLVDPGDHDSIDRHDRYFGRPIENFTRGSHRLYRFEAERAGFELFSGQRLELSLSHLICKNPFSRKNEERLLDYCRQSVASDRNIQFMGIDQTGIDIRNDGFFQRIPSGQSWTTPGDVMAFVAAQSKW